jgi:hypothetical protein
MKTLVNNPSVSPATDASNTASPAGTHWLWWLFLAGVMACSFAGQTCSLN